MSIMSLFQNHDLDGIVALILSYRSSPYNFNIKINKCEMEHRLQSCIEFIILFQTKYNFYFIEEFIKLKKSVYLLNKYTQYNDDYNRYFTNNDIIHPIVIDIINTGLNIPFSYSTFNSFTTTTEYDLKLACSIFSNSINSDYGKLRCRDRVTPIFLACLNEHISNDIIIWMLKNGSNKNHKHILNGTQISILDDLDIGVISESRMYDIQDIFNTYTFHEKI